MPRILVQPEYLRSVSTEWQRAAGELQALVGRLGSAFGSLDWEVREHAAVDEAWGQARGHANKLAGQAEDLARYLVAKAQAFEEADRAGATGIGQVLGMFAAAQRPNVSWWQRLQPILTLPGRVVSRWLRLGSITASDPLTWVTTMLWGLGEAAGGLLVGTRVLRPTSPEWQKRLEQATPKPTVEPGALSESVKRKFAEMEKPAVPARPPALDQVVRLQDGREILASQLDGRTPVAGLDSVRGKPGQFPLQAPITSDPGSRHPDLYAAVINQFGVEGNPRYTRDDYTYCNTFAGDVARAMGVPLPTKAEFLGRTGDPATVGAADLHRWFTTRSSMQGWREVDPNTPDGLRLLQEQVNAGRPAFAVDPGHIAVIRPGQKAASVADLHIAQAGAHNLNDVRLGDAGLGSAFKPRYFIHD